MVCSASSLLGQTFDFVNHANCHKNRLFQTTQGFCSPWCTILFRYPTRKIRRGEIRRTWGQLTEAQGKIRRPLKRSCSQARLSRDVRVWVAGLSSWNLCWLSVSAQVEFRARKKRLSTAMYRRVMTVTVSPATFKSERWLQARLMRTIGLKINSFGTFNTSTLFLAGSTRFGFVLGASETPPY